MSFSLILVQGKVGKGTNRIYYLQRKQFVLQQFIDKSLKLLIFSFAPEFPLRKAAPILQIPYFSCMSKPDKKLFLLDAMALIYRAHFAFSKNPRINSKGTNTGAVYGFTNSLLEIIQKEKPTHLGVGWDTEAPTFRHKEYEEYKAQREKQPEDIKVAKPYIRDIIKAFNIPILELDGFEADDVIGTIAKKSLPRRL